MSGYYPGYGSSTAGTSHTHNPVSSNTTVTVAPGTVWYGTNPSFVYPYVGWYCCQNDHGACRASTCNCACHGHCPEALQQAQKQIGAEFTRVKKGGKMSMKKPESDLFYVVIREDGNEFKGPFKTEEAANEEAQNLAGTNEATRPKYYVMASRAFVQRPAPEIPVRRIVAE